MLGLLGDSNYEYEYEYEHQIGRICIQPPDTPGARVL
jgi:hypothetical protein